MSERAQASKLAYLPVTSFIQNTASRSPTPGGGAVAALSGSLGASLCMMVCRLTTGKKRFALVEEAMRARVEALLPLRDRLRELIDLDASAFDQVMAAYGLAQDTEEERAARMGAVSAAYEAATEVPLEVARLCMEALELAEAIAREGSENALSDAAVGGLSLHAGFRGAMCNVRINLPEVPEGPLREAAEAAVALWPARADLLAEAVRVAVDQRMVG